MIAYLDNAATTPVSPEAAQAACNAMTTDFGNPSTQYPLGKAAKKALDGHRKAVADALGCKPAEVVFTSCGTESDNWALRLGAQKNRRKGRHIITTAFEHSAILQTCHEMEAEGWEVTYLMPNRQGQISLDDLKAALRPNTVLVSMMLVNNELGCVLPVKEAAALVKAYDKQILFHTDAVQGFLKVPFTPAGLGVDLLSLSGHKIHAPKGIGALFVRDSQRQTLHPPYVGGHQERGMRPGTENTPYIVGLGLAAAKGAQRLRTKDDHLHALNRQLRTGLAELPGITLNSPDDAVDEVVNFSTGCINSQTFINYLNGRLVFVSGGSACDKGEPSHTLQAMGCDDLTIRTALRVSFCADNTPEDVDALLDGLRAGLRELQHI